MKLQPRAVLALTGALALSTALFSAHAFGAPAKAAVKSPVPPTHENLLAGAAAYREQCAGCHGPAGTPTRKFPRLEHQPAVLTSADTQHDPISVTYNTITHGQHGGMPAFADDLTETQRWQTAMFVHRLGKDAAAYTAELPPEKQ